MSVRDSFNKWLAAVLCFTSAMPVTFAQETQEEAILPVSPRAPLFIRPYTAAYVPPVQMANSGRLASLIRAGKLYLTVQDAIALALENNIDIEVARYTPILDAWNVERAEAGGALPGVPSGQSQARTVIRGQGVRGSQAAAGVSTGTGATTGNNTQNATISQIGPVTPALDPIFQNATTFSHLSQPQYNLRQSLVTNLIDNQRNYTTTLQQGFLSGGQATITYTAGYLNENSPTDILNPQFAVNMQLSIQQNFLQGFGTAVNSRTIDVAKINLRIDDLNFKSQVISVVDNVLNLYFALVADNEDLKARQSAVTVAEQFYANNKRQVELGALAPLDITSAESQVASAQQALVISRTTLAQQQVQLKNVLSRSGAGDPLLANADIVPLDRIEVPEQDNLPPLKDLIATALRNRVDVAARKLNLDVAETNSRGTRNGVRPQLLGFANGSGAGQAGTAQFVPQSIPQASASASQQFPPGFSPCPPPNQGRICETPDPYFVGSVGNAVGQVFRRNYPTESGGTFFAARLRNRQAQADYAIDQLTIRQTELQDQQATNQISVDVSNQVIGLQQARVRYLAAVKNRALSQQLLDAEQKKFALGASTPYNVVSQQSALATAQSSEIAALVAYSNSRVALQQTLGTTLEENHVSIQDALSGRLALESAVPSNPPAQP